MRRPLLSLLAWSCLVASAAAADAGADAVSALAQLTDPARIAALSEAAFVQQLGPALGWLHVARRRDISPEAVIARAFALNGLDPTRAQLTRDCLLRNLARADGWELFQNPASAQAMALGQPALIPTGLHRGRLTRTDFAPGDGPRQFADLVLRSDDEPPLRPRPRTPTRAMRPDERLARSPTPSGRRRAKVARIDPVPTEYDALPAQ